MNKTLRLSIPTPCTEDWAKMVPAEQGRHCEQCCKTVVDFTGMSDEAVLGYFKERTARRANAGGGTEGSGVCGRLTSEQLGRVLAPAPVQRNGVKGWPWVVAGALVLGKGPDGGRPVKAGTEVRGGAAGQVRGGGGVAGQPDTVGTMAVIVGVIGLDEPVAVPKVRREPGVVMGEPKPEEEAFNGKVMIVADTPRLAIRFPDTVSGIKVVVDSVVDLLKDTVGAVKSALAGAFGSDAMVKVYPNPVTRGGVLRMEWNAAGGRYQMALVSAGGVPVQERMIEVGGKGQVDEWAVPGGLAAGVYFLRIARPGGQVCTKEVVVQ